MSIETIKVPDIGGVEGAEVIEVCIAVGDQVEQEDSLIVLETDKASMEVPSPVAGKVKSIKAAEGDTLSEGDIILELETAVEAAEPARETAAEPVVTADEPAVAEVTPVAAVVAEPSLEKIQFPDLGGASDVDVIEVCVAAGDDVAEGDSLVVLETDKASMEVPAPMGGKVVSVSVKEGDQVSEGDHILQLETLGTAPVSVEESPLVSAPAASSQSASASASAPAAQALTASPQAAAALVESAAQKGGTVYAGPAVRMLAREMGIVLSEVIGSGPKGRIIKDDLKAYVKKTLTEKSSAPQGAGVPAIPAVDFSKFGEVSLEPISKIGKVTAANMQRSWLNVPHVTQFDDADITDLEDFRKSLKADAERRGVKITPLPFLLKACAAALKAHPKFNASLHADGEHIVYKQYVNIGMAVDTPAGLVVPVIKDVDKKSVWDLAAETVELATKAKERKLKPTEMQGGCFTISSLGGIGGNGFTPIVNAPEVAILGVSKLSVKPVWNGTDFEPRKMLPLCLSYDHRAINGADAGRFFTYLGQLLGDIRLLAL